MGGVEAATSSFPLINTIGELMDRYNIPVFNLCDKCGKQMYVKTTETETEITISYLCINRECPTNSHDTVNTIGD